MPQDQAPTPLPEGDPDAHLAGETALRYWFRLSGISKNALARAVSERAAERGHHQVRPDGSRVRRWIENGERPRDPVPGLLAEVLSERTGYRLSAADLGLGPSPADENSRYRGPTETLRDIRRTASTTLAQGPHTKRDDAAPPEEPRELLSALESWSWKSPRPLPSVTSHGRLDTADIERIAAHTAALRQMDNRHGGASMLYMAAAHLATTNSLIKEGTYTETTGRLLFRELGDLCGVVGWAAHDSADYPTAVRYLTMAVQAARESGDRNLTAHLLQCLARVWGYVGHPQLARDCIALSLYGARNTASPVLRAGLHALDARFAALLGIPRDALRSIGLAQEIFTEDETDETPAYVAYLNHAELCSTLGEVLLFLARTSGESAHAAQAVDLLNTAVAQRDAKRARSSAFDAIAAARALLVTGGVDAACEAGRRALAIGTRVDSARVRRRFLDLAREAAAYRDVPGVDDLRERLVDAGDAAAGVPGVWDQGRK
ncbi:transcriptional regulator [Streptomyces sp. NPDC002537]